MVPLTLLTFLKKSLRVGGRALGSEDPEGLQRGCIEALRREQRRRRRRL